MPGCCFLCQWDALSQLAVSEHSHVELNRKISQIIPNLSPSLSRRLLSRATLTDDSQLRLVFVTTRTSVQIIESPVHVGHASTERLRPQKCTRHINEPTDTARLEDA